MEHRTLDGWRRGYYCKRCGESGCTIFATGHGPNKCHPQPTYVKKLDYINSSSFDKFLKEHNLGWPLTDEEKLLYKLIMS